MAKIRLFVLSTRTSSILLAWNMTLRRRMISVLEMCLFSPGKAPHSWSRFCKMCHCYWPAEHILSPLSPFLCLDNAGASVAGTWEGAGLGHQGFCCRISIRWMKAHVGELSSTVCHPYGLRSSHFWNTVVEYLPESEGRILDWFSAEAVGRRET